MLKIFKQSLKIKLDFIKNLKYDFKQFYDNLFQLNPHP